MVKPQHLLHAARNWDDLVAKMTQAISNKPESYLAMPFVLFDQNRINRMEVNFKRLLGAIDRLAPDTVCMSTKACEEYKGCPYSSLCANGADAGNPEQVLNMPEIGMYEFVRPHIELAEEA